VKEFLYKIIGRLSLVLDYFKPLVFLFQKKRGDSWEGFDKTGLVAGEKPKRDVLWEDQEVLFIDYDNFAHAFWRAQELSLFKMHKELIEGPVLDFGCGDGSFAASLFEEVDYGVDNDPEALELAKISRVYKALLKSTDHSIPLPASSVKTVISNSVLEHLLNVDYTLSEIRRILKKDGLLIFTVPVPQFKKDIAKYFGCREGTRVNRESYHRNLFDAELWTDTLRKHGFAIVKQIQFQPEWFTFWHWMFRFLGGRTMLGKFLHGVAMVVWKFYKKDVVEMVRISINQTISGACIFVIAKKL